MHIEHRGINKYISNCIEENFYTSVAEVENQIEINVFNQIGEHIATVSFNKQEPIENVLDVLVYVIKKGTGL